METSIAGTQPLAIPELFEIILLKVDQRSLLTSCIRVSRTWNEMVRTSRLLQQYLYFLPSSPTTIEFQLDKIAMCTKCNHTYTATYVLNPLPAQGFPHWFICSDVSRTEGQWNEAFKHMDDPPIFHHSGPWDCMDIAEKVLDEFKMLPWNANPDAWRRKEASWRRMEVTQPPIRALQIEDVVQSNINANRIRRGRLSFPSNDSFRMGDVYDWVEKRALHYREDGGIAFHRRTFKIRIDIDKDYKAATLWLTLEETEISRFHFPGLTNEEAPKFTSKACQELVEVKMSEWEQIRDKIYGAYHMPRLR